MPSNGKIRPDYKCCSRSSGRTDDREAAAKKIYDGKPPWQWPRWFDDKRRKRKVHIVVKNFYGDYHHWYAELVEEHNPFWLPAHGDEKATWVNDSRSHGRKFSEKFNTKQSADSYVDLIMRDHFEDRRPVFQKRGGSHVLSTWHYSREGD